MLACSHPSHANAAQDKILSVDGRDVRDLDIGTVGDMLKVPQASAPARSNSHWFEHLPPAGLGVVRDEGESGPGMVQASLPAPFAAMRVAQAWCRPACLRHATPKHSLTKPSVQLS
jgi:hypothetical protein